MRGVMPSVIADEAVPLGAWDRLWPLLVTAGLSLLVVMVVQIYVVPWVESRKRREDRWENDLRKLGECAAFDVTDAASEYASTLARTVWLLAVVDDEQYDQERLRERLREVDERRWAARERYRRSTTQLVWLTNRVCEVAAGHLELRKLRVAAMGVEIADLTDADPTYLAEDAEVTDELVQRATDANREAVRKVLAQVNVLGQGRAPHAESRFSRGVKRLRARAVRLRRRPTRPPGSRRRGRRSTVES